ncbi:hypothetical protein BDP27DRAFT_290077 [Rhodocollybia butyracea]|uniref:Uncharacterized protein n=1 Tax=Rhodocollybia butyracea TaxID=206335 RepID=A0A9P5U0D7_9AGAR|nr:hypothetical protein BDP27DRAFT_290077 [Rhodocollybia butyracea]
MNRWNSTTSSIVNGVNAQGHFVVPSIPTVIPPLPSSSQLLPSARQQHGDSSSHSSQQQRTYNNYSMPVPSMPMPQPDPSYGADAGPSTIVRRPTDILRELRGEREEIPHSRNSYSEDRPEAAEPAYSEYDWDGDYQHPPSPPSHSHSQSQSSSRRQQPLRNWEYEYEYGYSDSDNANVGVYSSDEFINYSLLSHIAVQLRDKVPRGTHVKGRQPYEGAFTGQEVVVSISSLVVLLAFLQSFYDLKLFVTPSNRSSKNTYCSITR